MKLSRQRIGISTSRKHTPWFLTGNIPPSSCVAAYRAVGARNFIESYRNLAHPGTHTITPGAIKPLFSTANGWEFLYPSVNGTHLVTDIIPNLSSQAWTAIICFKDIVYNATLFGLDSSSTFRTFYIRTTGVNYWNGYYKSATVSPAAGNGTLGFAGRTAYRNGVAEGTITAGGNTCTEPIFIGASNGGAAFRDPIGGKISSIAIYNTTLSDVQMRALHLAMTALQAETYPYYGKYYIVFGDSKTNVSWTDPFTRQLQWADNFEWTVNRYGVGGRRTDIWADQYINTALSNDTARVDPDFVLWNSSVNDFGILNETSYKNAAQYCIDAFHTKWPSAKIYMVKPWKRDFESDATNMATWIDDLIALQPTVCYLGHNESIWMKGADNGATMTSDGIHPSAAGYVELVNQWKTILGY